MQLSAKELDLTEQAGSVFAKFSALPFSNNKTLGQQIALLNFRDIYLFHLEFS